MSLKAEVDKYVDEYVANAQRIQDNSPNVRQALRDLFIAVYVQGVKHGVSEALKEKSRG